MTLDEALNELGIDRETDADGARRAYLRLLKKRKPEVDRDGFMRLREAYEHAKTYFEHIEMFRAIEKAANAESSSTDGAPQLVRVETPAGIVWVQTKPSPATTVDEPIVQDKPLVQDKPPVVDDVATVENVAAASEAPIEEPAPVEDAPVEAEVVTFAHASAVPDVESITKAPEAEPSEPSIDELIAAGKLKRAARRMGQEYRLAMEKGTIGVEVPSPHQAVLLLLRMHEKNRVAEAKVLEKEFAEWLSSTGASVRIMAGPMGVMWMMARELGAVSKNFPSELREGISKAVIAGKLDDLQRRAGWYQLSDPDGARNAALDLHAHAPSLAGLLGETLAPAAARVAPGRSSSRGGWGYGIVFVVLMNVIRLFASAPTDRTTSYRGQSDPGEYYRPSPSPASQAPSKPIATSKTPAAESGLDNSIKIDVVSQNAMLVVAENLEKAADKSAPENERSIVQRARFVRVAIEKGTCAGAEAELNGFVTDMFVLSDPLKAKLLPNAKKLDSMFRAACQKKDTAKVPRDGGPNKKP